MGGAVKSMLPGPLPTMLLKQDAKGCSPLMLAAVGGFAEAWDTAVEALLRHGADPGQVDNKGRTVLHYLAKGVNQYYREKMSFVVPPASLPECVVGVLRVLLSDPRTNVQTRDITGVPGFVEFDYGAPYL